MKWAEALAELNRLSATCEDKAEGNEPLTGGKRELAPEVDHSEEARTPTDLVAIRELPSFWTLISKEVTWHLVYGNGLLYQLGVDTSTRRILALIKKNNPRLFDEHFAKHAGETELERLMAGMTATEKKDFRMAMVQALNHIIAHADSDLHRAARFISEFCNVFTLNLDTLQPTVYNHVNACTAIFNKSFEDAFKMEGDVGIWTKGPEQNWYYPHGNVCLAHSPRNRTHYKLSLSLLRNTKEANKVLVDRKARPLIILDSSSGAKMKSIRNSTYLERCLEALACIKGRVCFYGLGLEKDTDKHLWDAVDYNAGIDDIYVAVKSITYKTLADVKCRLPKSHGKVTFFDRDSI